MNNSVTKAVAGRPTELISAFIVSCFAVFKAFGPTLDPEQDAAILGLIGTSIPVVTLIAATLKKEG